MFTWSRLSARGPVVDLPTSLLSTGVRRHSDTSDVSSRLIHVYMPNLVCPSVRPVWCKPIWLRICGGSLPRWFSEGLWALMRKWTAPRWFLVSSFPSSDFCPVVPSLMRVNSSVRGCHLGYVDEVTRVTLFSSQLVPWSRRARVREQNDACSLAAITSSWTVRHYKAVRMTSEPYADNVPMSFVSLHYAPLVSQPPFLCLLSMSLHALFTCLPSTSASFRSNVWPQVTTTTTVGPTEFRLEGNKCEPLSVGQSFYESLSGCKRVWFCRQNSISWISHIKWRLIEHVLDWKVRYKYGSFVSTVITIES